MTPAGAAYIDRVQTASEVGTAIFLIVRDGTPSNFAPASVVTRKTNAVELAAPGTPPPGRVGVYSDGQHHAYAAATDGEGELLYMDVDNGRVTTDVAELVFPISLTYL